MIRLSLAILLLPLIALADEPARTVTLGWDALKKAASYEIEVRGPDSAARTFETFDAEWKGELKPGRYVFRVRALDRRGVAGPWGAEETFSVKVAAAKYVRPAPGSESLVDDERPVSTEFAWLASKGADRYLFRVRGGEFEKSVETRETSVRVDLPVGAAYKWSVQTISASGERSDEQPVTYVLLSRAAGRPIFDVPASEFVRRITWKIPELADGTDIGLQRLDPEKNEWIDARETFFTKDGEFAFPAEWPGGRYRISAWAVKQGRPISRKSEMEFSVFGGDRSPASETRHALESYFGRDSGRFFHANSVFSSVDYQSVSAVYNTRQSFAAVTGTANLGAGYMWGGNRGVRGSVDLGGIVIDGKNSLRKGFELSYVQRHRLGDFSDSRWWAGLTYEDLVDVVKPVTRDEAEVSMIPVPGVVVGGDVWYAFTGVYGVKLQGAYGRPLSARLSTGESLSAGSILKVGVFGTYNLTADRQFHLGLTSKSEKYVFDGAGAVTPEISISGTYVNFQYEMGF